MSRTAVAAAILISTLAVASAQAQTTAPTPPQTLAPAAAPASIIFCFYCLKNFQQHFYF